MATYFVTFGSPACQATITVVCPTSYDDFKELDAEQLRKHLDENGGRHKAKAFAPIGDKTRDALMADGFAVGFQVGNSREVFVRIPEPEVTA